MVRYDYSLIISMALFSRGLAYIPNAASRAAAFSTSRITPRKGDIARSVTAMSPLLLSSSTSMPSSSMKIRPHRMSSTGRYQTNGEDEIAQATSYEVDEDEETEQHLADHPPKTINGDSTSSTVVNGAPKVNGKTPTTTTTNGEDAVPYQELLTDVGIYDKLKTIHEIPKKRPLSPNDVFCNRELKLGGLKAMGFDMDYTLAQYKQPAFDKLAFDGAIEKLVYALGYPKEVLDFEYDHKFWVRGLIIDTQRGNFLKIDRHKYVRLAYHGFSPISSTTRKHLYSRTFNKVPSFTEKHFVNMDTLFQHVDAHIFASLVEMKDRGDHEFLDERTYEEIYRQVRECVDLCHRDGVIKDEVARNPEKYLVLDDGLFPMLKNYRDAGLKVFLLTNSYWEYTSVVMNYLFHGKKVDDELKKKNVWLDYFDICIVGSCKPAFLVDPYLNLFRVRPEDGSLLNTDGLFEIEALGKDGAQKFLEMGKTFQGGNWNHLQAMLEIDAGEEILYVGDHLYADVLRSKRTLGWRSAFIVPELSEEMRVFHENVPLSKKIIQLRKLRDELSLHGDMIRRASADPESDDVQAKLQQIEEDDVVIKDILTKMAEQYHAAFHPIWGQMFNAGYQDSRFAFFVQNYACLYTAKATNLGLASIGRSFRTSGEMLPHDKLLADAGTEFTPHDDESETI